MLSYLIHYFDWLVAIKKGLILDLSLYNGWESMSFTSYDFANNTFRLDNVARNFHRWNAKKKIHSSVQHCSKIGNWFLWTCNAPFCQQAIFACIIYSLDNVIYALFVVGGIFLSMAFGRLLFTIRSNKVLKPNSLSIEFTKPSAIWRMLRVLLVCVLQSERERDRPKPRLD